MPVVSMPSEIGNVLRVYINSVKETNGGDPYDIALEVINDGIERITKSGNVQGFVCKRPLMNESFSNMGYTLTYTKDATHGATFNDNKLDLGFTARKHMVLEALLYVLYQEKLIVEKKGKIVVKSTTSH